MLINFTQLNTFKVLQYIQKITYNRGVCYKKDYILNSGTYYVSFNDDRLFFKT